MVYQNIYNIEKKVHYKVHGERFRKIVIETETINGAYMMNNAQEKSLSPWVNSKLLAGMLQWSVFHFANLNLIWN